MRYPVQLTRGPSSTRSVTAANAARIDQHSQAPIASALSSDPSRTWSGTQIESKPSCSARWANSSSCDHPAVAPPSMTSPVGRNRPTLGDRVEAAGARTVSSLTRPSRFSSTTAVPRRSFAVSRDGKASSMRRSVNHQRSTSTASLSGFSCKGAFESDPSVRGAPPLTQLCRRCWHPPRPLPRSATHGRHLDAEAVRPPKFVSDMLGYGIVGLTLDTASHLLPAMPQQAASAMDAIFAGW